MQIVAILDRSGSMESMKKAAISGFNEFLATQKLSPDGKKITVHLFDHEFLTPTSAKNISEVEPLTDETYKPRGNTALLDAVGRAIYSLEARCAGYTESTTEPAIVLIVTDGEENASKEFTQAHIRNLIERVRREHKWEVAFIGNSDFYTKEQIARNWGVQTMYASSNSFKDARSVQQNYGATLTASVNTYSEQLAKSTTNGNTTSSTGS